MASNSRPTLTSLAVASLVFAACTPPGATVVVESISTPASTPVTTVDPLTSVPEIGSHANGACIKPSPGDVFDGRYIVERFEDWPRLALCTPEGGLLDEVEINAEGTARRRTDLDSNGIPEVWVGGTSAWGGGADGWTVVDDRIVPIMTSDGQLSWSFAWLDHLDAPSIEAFGCDNNVLSNARVEWDPVDLIASWNVVSWEIDGATATVHESRSGTFVLPTGAREFQGDAAMAFATDLVGHC
ncbi:MAG: hypothetical protein ACR2P0_02605 [Acidimicrobiales bacterium]